MFIVKHNLRAANFSRCLRLALGLIRGLEFKHIHRYVQLGLMGLCLFGEGPILRAGAPGQAEFQQLAFSGIPSTIYSVSSQSEFSAVVDKSASSLFLPFASPQTVSSLALQWKMTGHVQTKDSAHEETKDGDDFPLRIGLCLSGKEPLVPFFTPSWVKLIQNNLKHPSDKLLYLVMGSKHPPGARWKSPYSSSIENIAVPSDAREQGWQSVDFALPRKSKAVCMWIMSDGDDTKSSFQLRVTGLQLK